MSPDCWLIMHSTTPAQHSDSLIFRSLLAPLMNTPDLDGPRTTKHSSIRQEVYYNLSVYQKKVELLIRVLMFPKKKEDFLKQFSEVVLFLGCYF